ncbi:MAG: GNAT family N-acetyltransferase [Armatimonadetes bacterium]|nr:GNAT family N-acetyltransferase [Armatimonadota bacterium]
MPRAVPSSGKALVRYLDLDDSERIAEIDRQLTGQLRPEYWRDQIFQCKAGRGISVGAEVDGRLVGYMMGSFRGGEFGLPQEVAWVEHLGVEPEWRGRGIGAMMAEAVFKRCRRRGIETAYTLVGVHDETIHTFFRALGFRQVPFTCLSRRL